MARTIAEIAAALTEEVNDDAVIGTGGSDPLTSDSDAAIWEAWVQVVAIAQQTLEENYDNHKAEVAAIIAGQKPHTREWYATMAKAFQYGDSLAPDQDYYATIDPTVQIVAFAAAVEVTPLLRIKVAKLVAGVLTPLSGPELIAFTGYMNAIKDAGVALLCTSGPADTYQPTMIIYYDPQVMGADGSLLSSPGGTPVKDAVNAFLQGIPFNGIYVQNAFIAAMQAVEGVKIADVEAAQAFYGAVPPVVINEATPPQYVPDAGYMALDAGWFTAHVSYVPYAG